MKTLYFDCFAGASGDMILGALASLGVGAEELNTELKKLNIADFRLDFSTVERSGISATKANVEVPHEHAHRHLHTIEKIINDSNLPEKVKTRAIEIFTNLARAEAKIHGIDIQKVHFHEVGALDAIIDVVGACVGFEILEIEQFFCSKIHTGSGFAKMAHGKFPVPPPAVAELLQNIPIYSTEIEGELVTPTGAAIISTVCGEYGKIPEMRVEKTGYGAGTREYKDFPNVLRLMLGEIESPKSKVQSPKSKVQSLKFKVEKSSVENQIPTETDHRPPTTDNLLLIETNIDDLSPQILGFVMERAFESGALDCWFTPIQMKKNRPATQISILCNAEKRETLIELLYTETTTLGVRISHIERNCLPREIVKVATNFGEIDVKIARLNGKIVNAKPEYDCLREFAIQSKKPLREIEQEILSKLR